MLHQLDLRAMKPKDMYPLEGFGGCRPNGEQISFSNYYMEQNGQPYFGVSGEIHYARLWEARWEDAILKMKAGGVNIISAYLFWIHHEEAEGEFDFSGRRNVRGFIELCRKHGLSVIVRVGPFCHGECRNGGLPDWLYGKPFEVRSLDEGFLACVEKWYRAVARELDGLWYGQNGPIIGCQIDNEYMHSAAPWEITTGTTNEWCPAGEDGDAYLLKLMDIARAEGIDAPFYTCTGWGGAAMPSGMMPLWGGYAFRPWIFYSHVGEHPATEEYIYRDCHNDAVPETYNFDPKYSPESRPYLCCEMGGGMFCSYNYRFQLPFESVDAMANIKMGSGCNMLGYYMYAGGTNPMGKRGTFMNEGQVPKRSYDFQAPIGEYGQLRNSYRRLRCLHLLADAFQDRLCRMKTVLPAGSQDIEPMDDQSLRWAVRVDERGSGFVFINNYQDHARMSDKQGETIQLRLPGGDIVFDDLSLAAGENCVLPFNMEIGGVLLKIAHVQPLAVADGTAFFFAPEGMRPRYVFPAGTQVVAESGVVCEEKENVRVDGELPRFAVRQGSAVLRVVTLSRADSLRFSMIEGRAVLSDGAVMAGADGLRIEHDQPTVRFEVYENGEFVERRLKKTEVELTPILRQVGPTRYALDIPDWNESEVKDVMLRMDYVGDVASAFLGGEMIADNFSNGAVWEIALREYKDKLKGQPLTIVITPIKQGCGVNVESTMAGRKEDVLDRNGALLGAALRSVYAWNVGKEK